jgi:hypothetical protein
MFSATIQGGSSGTFCEEIEIERGSSRGLQCPIDLDEEYLYLGRTNRKETRGKSVK